PYGLQDRSCAATRARGTRCFEIGRKKSDSLPRSMAYAGFELDDGSSRGVAAVARVPLLASLLGLIVMPSLPCLSPGGAPKRGTVTARFPNSYGRVTGGHESMETQINAGQPLP